MKVIPYPVTAFQFGLLTAIEMATAVLIYVPVDYLADRSGKKPFVVTSSPPSPSGRREPYGSPPAGPT